MKKVIVFLILNFLALSASASNGVRNPKMKISPEKFLKHNATIKYQNNDDFPWDTFCVDYNVPDGTFFPHPLDCNWYFLCWDSELVVGACEEGLYFNPDLGICDLEENYDCVLGLFPEWGDQQCPPPGSNELRLLPHHFCNMFYICINGDPIPMQCRPGHHWNADELYCDDPRTAGCDGESDGIQILPDCPATFVGSIPHPQNCNMFIHCSNGNRFIQRCPHLHVFDITSARCAVNGDCIDEYLGRRRN